MSRNRAWFVLLLFFFTAFALGQTTTPPDNSSTTLGFFSIPSLDVSKYLLGYVFDNVGSVLTFPGNSTIFKNVLIDFNNAALVLGAIVIIYSLFVSTLNTAHEGQMLGEKWNSVWIPLRAAGGFSLMLPLSAKGYAVIQVFVMWVILQGVGAADTIWGHALTAITTGTSTIPQTSPGNYQLAANIFVSAACTNFLNHELLTNGNLINQGAFFGPQYSIILSKPNTSKALWLFGNNPNFEPSSSKKAAYLRMCGTLAPDKPPLVGVKTVHNDTLSSMISSLQPAAGNYARAYESNSDMTQSPAVLTSSAQSLRAAGDMMTTAIQNYYRSIATPSTPSSSQNTPLPPQVEQYLATAKNLGWALAGAYYLGISRLATISSTWNPIYQSPEQTLGPGGWLQILTKSQRNDVGAFVANVTIFSISAASQLTQNQMQYTPIDFSAPGISSAEKRAMLPWLNSYPLIDKYFRVYIITTAQQWATINFFSGSDPVSQLIQLGANIERQAQQIWLLVIGTVTSLGIVAAATGGIGTPIMTFALAWYAPFVMFTLTTAIVSGFLFEIYVPLIPFLLFTMGVLGWVILTIEAMVAAPLLALGILHPEGQHQVWGKGEAGIMIIASAFLRPSLMVCGLFAAIPVTYGVVGFVNFGFTLALYGLAGSTDTSQIVVFRPIATALFMSLYAVIILLTFNRIYSLIHVLPDRIMRWIGVQEERGYSAEQDLQQMQSGIKEAGQGAASSMKESMESQAGAAADYAASKSGGGKEGGSGGTEVGGSS